MRDDRVLGLFESWPHLVTATVVLGICLVAFVGLLAFVFGVLREGRSGPEPRVYLTPEESTIADTRARREQLDALTIVPVPALTYQLGRGPGAIQSGNEEGLRKIREDLRAIQERGNLE